MLDEFATLFMVLHIRKSNRGSGWRAG